MQLGLVVHVLFSPIKLEESRNFVEYFEACFFLGRADFVATPQPRPHGCVVFSGELARGQA